jgi:vancomycin resistance protein YoaR
VIDTNLASLNINTLVGSGVSSFRNSQQYRITNIQAGARQLHGILVPPGETFSFNNNLGAVDSSNGFVQGAAIVDNRTQLEWGGGLCQVSTTMFRAAFWSGLPIAERHEHRFRIGWYEELGEPPGLDAAIFTGVSDLRFVNDTGGWILIQTYVDLSRQQITIALYGRPTHRHVTLNHRVLERTPAPRKPLYLSDPTLPRGTFKQTDWARPGMHVQVYRTVENNGQVVRQDTFDTIFEPWPNIYVRGTG